MTTTAEKYTIEQSIHNTLDEGERYDRARKERAVIHWFINELFNNKAFNYEDLNYDNDENEWTCTYGYEGKDVAKMKIYTEEEARTLAYDSLYESVKDEFSSSGLPSNWSDYFDINGLIEDALNTDGVNHHCGLESEYNHCDEFEYEGVYYYMGIQYFEVEE